MLDELRHSKYLPDFTFVSWRFLEFKRFVHGGGGLVLFKTRFLVSAANPVIGQRHHDFILQFASTPHADDQPGPATTRLSNHLFPQFNPVRSAGQLVLHFIWVCVTTLDANAAMKAIVAPIGIPSLRPNAFEFFCAHYVETIEGGITKQPTDDEAIFSPWREP
ncbi:hypothetical protein Pan97_07190 [Bremerella volcania]|uniref:Uncharacterized protein n=1 Tax=Bremerella volcania TaxID=2527984 RepID=A0A518C3B7_9BACT|nr:hypothetical protein [Bremerella volcania]QDU73720.1 hypothetical protein Pan97_07190 [Bremerella volcania]